MLYHLWKTSGTQFRSFLIHSKCKTVQLLVLWVTKVFVTYVRLQTQPKFFQKMNLRTKNNFFVYGENTYHSHSFFIQFSVRMELYEIVWKEISHLWELYGKHFWSTREDAPFVLFLLFQPLWSFRQIFHMFKDMSVDSRNIQTQNCATIQCTIWPRNVINLDFIDLFVLDTAKYSIVRSLRRS